MRLRTRSGRPTRRREIGEASACSQLAIRLGFESAPVCCLLRKQTWELHRYGPYGPVSLVQTSLGLTKGGSGGLRARSGSHSSASRATVPLIYRDRVVAVRRAAVASLTVNLALLPIGVGVLAM